MAVAVAFLLVVSFAAHLRAARDPGPDPLRQARHPAAVAVAAAAGVAAAEAADHKGPASFLVGRVPRPSLRH